MTKVATARESNTCATVAFASNWKLPAKLDIPQDALNELKLREIMAAFNPKRFTNPNVVRTIEPGRLLDFLRPYQDYLCDRGVSLPSPRHATHLDLDRLVELLLTPSERAKPTPPLSEESARGVSYARRCIPTAEAADKITAVYGLHRVLPSPKRADQLNRHAEWRLEAGRRDRRRSLPHSSSADGHSFALVAFSSM